MGRRGPLIAGVVGLALAVSMVFALVLPKMNELTEAEAERRAAEAQQERLQSQLRALEDAEEAAPQNQATIAEVDRQVPPTADVPGVILLLDNSATQSSLDLKVFTPTAPAYDTVTGLSRIDIRVNVEGTYFEIDEFLFRIETLPRAAKVLNVTISPMTGTGALAMVGTVQVYTSDTSAGPGSSPGPTEEAPEEAAA